MQVINESPDLSKAEVFDQSQAVAACSNERVPRTQVQIGEYYEIEKELAESLRQANASDANYILPFMTNFFGTCPFSATYKKTICVRIRPSRRTATRLSQPFSGGVSENGV